MRRLAIGLIFLLLCSLVSVVAQTPELAATLEVLQGDVEVRRVNTAAWLPVKVEAIVGVGDAIRTKATGHARITFFADGTSTDILPQTEYHIIQLVGDEKQFEITVSVVFGQTIQRLQRLLDNDSIYQVLTPGMTLAARGTEFAVRVKDSSGQSAMIVQKGTVQAGQTATDAEVPDGFGIRAEKAGQLSEVVRASSFAALDAALDGCSVQLAVIPGDTSLNVRQTPHLQAEIIGYIIPTQVLRLFGVTETSKWYRVRQDGLEGWILPATVDLNRDCAGLRVFPDDPEPGGANAP